MDGDNKTVDMDTSSVTVESTINSSNQPCAVPTSEPVPNSAVNNRKTKKLAKRKQTYAAYGRTDDDSQPNAVSSAASSAPSTSRSQPSQSELLPFHPAHLCRFWIKRKARFCTFDIETKSNQEFCGFHDPTNTTICEFCKTPIRIRNTDPAPTHPSEATSSSSDNRSNETENQPRPKKLSTLEQHLLVCPKRKFESTCALLPFYQANVNGVWRTTPSPSSATASIETVSADASASAGDHDEAPPKETSLHDVPRDELWALIRTLDDIGRRCFGFDENCVEDSDAQTRQRMAEEKARLGGSASNGHGTVVSESIGSEKSSPASDNVALPSSSAPVSLSAHSRLRHQLQHESFFHVLDSHNLLRRGSLILEVGAGKAGLAGHIALRVEKEEKDKLKEQSQQLEQQPDDQHKLKKMKIASSSDALPPTDLSTPSPSSSHPSAAAPLASSLHTPSFTLVVLDRGSFKHKTDTIIRQQYAITRVEFKRYRIDLQDVVLERMPEVQQFITNVSGSASAAEMGLIETPRQGEIIQSTPLSVVIGKHVCGQATDFVCKAVARANSNSAAPTSPHAISCVAIATCCHHLCVWENYVNPSYIESLGLTPRQFHLMTRISTWRTCGYKAHKGTQKPQAQDADATTMDTVSDGAATPRLPPTRIDELHPTYQMSPAERTRIGFICKHIFDTGRVRFLKEQAGFLGVAERTAFTTSDITKENFMILLA